MMIFIIDWLMVILWEEDAFFYYSSAWLLTQYQWNVQKGSSMLLVVVLQAQQAVHENTHLQQPHLSSPKYSQDLHCCDSSPSLSPLHFNLFFPLMLHFKCHLPLSFSVFTTNLILFKCIRLEVKVRSFYVSQMHFDERKTVSKPYKAILFLAKMTTYITLIKH